MVIGFKQHEVRKYLRRNKKPQEEEIMSVSNRNGLTVEKHMELLNLNDEDHEYIEYLGNVES